MEHIKKLEIVEWRDANFAIDAKDLVDGDYINATVGWVQEDGRWLRIVSEITPGGERAITSVPMENVVRRVRLKIKGQKQSKSDLTSTTSQAHTESHS